MARFKQKTLQVFLCLSLVISLTPIGQAYADEAQVSATTGATIAITLTTNQEGAVAMTYGGAEYTSGTSVESGGELVLTLSNVEVGTNIAMPTTVTIGGVAQTINYNKASWQEANSEYKRLMNEDVKMTTYEKILASKITISAGALSADTEVNVQYSTLMPIYRMYNKITSEHLFSTNRTEYLNYVKLTSQNKENWIGEGVDWLSQSSGSPVYRLYNPALGAMANSSHYYTADETERANLKANGGWLDDFNGTPVFYSAGQKAIFTAYNQALRSAHHYTSDLSEYKGLVQHGWDIEADKSLKNKVWEGVFKCQMSAKFDGTDTEDWSGDIMLGAFTVSDADWSNQVYYSNDGNVFFNAGTAFTDPGNHIYSKADGNEHWCMSCPSIMYKDGYFWMLSSGGEWLDNGKASFVISYSKDFKTWTTPWGFTAAISGSTLGSNQVAPEWFYDEDTGKVYILQSMGEYGDFSGAGLGNDKMQPFICEVTNLTATDAWQNEVGMWIPSNLNPTFSSMQHMSTVTNAERNGSTDNMIDACMFKENGKYYYVIKNKGLWNDIFVGNSPMGNAWTKLVPNAVSWGYEAPSLAKFGGKYMLYMDGVIGTLPVGTRVQSATSLTGSWSNPVEPYFMNAAGKRLASRHGSVFVLKAGSEGWTKAKSALGLA